MLTPRARMLAAYEGRAADVIPVAPEFWYYIPARLLGVPMFTLELEIPHWQALQQTFRHYQCEGWGIVAPGSPVRTHSEQTWLADQRLDETTALGPLRSRRILDRIEPSWLVERYIKDFERDWPVYAEHFFVPPEELDWTPVQQALDAVGEDYLLEIYIGDPFIDFAGGQREGGLEQVIADLVDHPSEMAPCTSATWPTWPRIRAPPSDTPPPAACSSASIWSSLSLLSPAYWRSMGQTRARSGGAKRPRAAAASSTTTSTGAVARCCTELAALGLDCICPFERPPGGDVTDLREVANILGGRTTFNGNVHTVRTLIEGTCRRCAQRSGRNHAPPSPVPPPALDHRHRRPGGLGNARREYLGDDRGRPGILASVGI